MPASVHVYRRYRTRVEPELRRQYTRIRRYPFIGDYFQPRLGTLRAEPLQVQDKAADHCRRHDMAEPGRQCELPGQLEICGIYVAPTAFRSGGPIWRSYRG